MPETEFHRSFRDTVSLSLLFAALEKSFPLFRTAPDSAAVEVGGKETREEVFRKLQVFSTSFPQTVVDSERQI
jgi:hypothetical protein